MLLVVLQCFREVHEEIACLALYQKAYLNHAEFLTARNRPITLH